jgi:hypothetical protein
MRDAVLRTNVSDDSSCFHFRLELSKSNHYQIQLDLVMITNKSRFFPILASSEEKDPRVCFRTIDIFSSRNQFLHLLVSLNDHYLHDPLNWYCGFS